MVHPKTGPRRNGATGMLISAATLLPRFYPELIYEQICRPSGNSDQSGIAADKNFIKPTRTESYGDGIAACSMSAWEGVARQDNRMAETVALPPTREGDTPKGSSWTSGRPRISSQCLQHPLFLDALQAPLQKIDLQRLLADLPLQLRDPAFRPALLSVARKRIARPLRGTPAASGAARSGSPPTPRATSAIDTPCSSRRTAASLNSFVNCLRDNPMTQFSIQ